MNSKKHLAMIFTLVAIAGLVSTRGVSAALTTTNISPVADAAYALSGTTNYGTAQMSSVGRWSASILTYEEISRAIVKFDLTTKPSNITSIVLRVTLANVVGSTPSTPATERFNVNEATSTWTEAGITKDTAPTRGTLVGYFDADNTKRTHDTALPSSYFNKTGTVSFIISRDLAVTSGLSKAMYFREASEAADRPALIITHEAPPGNWFDGIVSFILSPFTLLFSVLGSCFGSAFIMRRNQRSRMPSM